MQSNRRNWNRRRPPRRGIAIIMVIAFYAVAIAMIGVWVRTALGHQQQVRRWHEKTQAAWLAAAGVQRAAARISSAKEYTGEHWQIQSTEISGDYSAEVVIRIEPIEALDQADEQTGRTSSRVRIIAVASYPSGKEKRVQSTKTLEFSLPAQSDLTGESS